jgi:flagellar basal-body rod modification protein FlgD
MALNTVPPATANTANRQAANITQQDFLRILLTQLTAQDPLKPMDNSAFVAQLAQFSQLEQTQEMSASVDKLLAVQTASQSMDMLGRTVAVQQGFSQSSGKVVDVSMQGSTPTFTVQPTSGANVPGVTADQIVDIK